MKRGFREATRRERTSDWLFVADRLLREETLEERWFAFGLLERLIVDDTERAWQLLRRASREAGDWITVDSLAHPVGKGILNEPYRWAELEQLVYSPSRWERRLVGSTIATMPHVDHRRGRDPEVASHGLGLIRDLIGDDEADVQKALAWALRSMAGVDLAATTAFLRDEAETAAATERRLPGVGHPRRAGEARSGRRRRDPLPARGDPPAGGRAAHLAGGRGRRPVRRRLARHAGAGATARHDQTNDR